MMRGRLTAGSAAFAALLAATSHAQSPPQNGNPLYWVSQPAPVASSGFGTGATVPVSNTALATAFTVNVGTSPGTYGIITVPAAPDGWACVAADMTTPGHPTTAWSTSATTIRLSTSVAWADNDVIQVGPCVPY
jgi:hypothetical protein